MAYDDGGADLRLAGKTVARMDGIARLVTTKDGKPLALIGISEKPGTVRLTMDGRGRKFRLSGNKIVKL
jgi:hypothetical protein